MEDGQEILNGRFRVINKMGSGTFGEIYKVEKLKTGEILAAKVEAVAKTQKNPMLVWESRLIHKLRGKTAVPNLHASGNEKTATGRNYHIMVMDLLGNTLEDLFK